MGEHQRAVRGQRLEFIGALTNGRPVMARDPLAKSWRKARLALSPVPTAVPPCASG